MRGFLTEKPTGRDKYRFGRRSQISAAGIA
jgi:hypothetical protein